MSTPEQDDVKRRERAQQVALFRYQVICPALDPELSTKARGRIVRAIAARTHAGPFGGQHSYSRDSLDRWIRRYRAGGFDALMPSIRQPGSRIDTGVLELAVALKRENPARTAAQVARILRASTGYSPSESTLLRLFHRRELIGPATGEAVVYGRFEADTPNQRWVGDALHGPRVGGRKTYLFAFLDDHSRVVTGYRFGFTEDAVRLAAAFEPALAARGVPRAAAKSVDGALTWHFGGWVRGVACGTDVTCGNLMAVLAPAVKPKATSVDAIFPDRRTGTSDSAAACRCCGTGRCLIRVARGVRHRVAGIVAVALTAVLAGARSYAAIASWAADLSVEQRAQVGLTRPRAPDASTFRRVLGRLDAVVLDAVVGAFVWTRTATVDGRRVIALDGKTVRGARTTTEAGTDHAPHLVAAFDHASGTVLGQLAIAAKSNEIPTVRTVLAGFDLTDVVVSVDAMHTQTDTAASDHRRRRGLRLHREGQPAHPVRGVQTPALARRPGPQRRAERPRAPSPPNHQGPGRTSVDHLHRRSPDRPDPPHRHPRRQDHRRGRLRDHLSRPPRRPTTSPGRLGPRPLGHREPRPLGPRRHLRRGQIPDPHRPRPPGHGHPTS